MGFKVWVLGFKVWGLGFEVYCFGVQDTQLSTYKHPSLEFRVSGLGFRV